MLRDSVFPDSVLKVPRVAQGTIVPGTEPRLHGTQTYQSLYNLSEADEYFEKVNCNTVCLCKCSISYAILFCYLSSDISTSDDCTILHIM